jgi:site-specific recombinase XerD
MVITIPRETFKKQITSPELTAQFNPENVKLVNRFLKYKNTSKSDGTITGYTSDLNIFFTWNLLYNENKLFTDLEKLELADYFGYGVEELHWSANRFSRCRSALSSLSEFIERFYDKQFPNFRNIVLKAVDLMAKSPVREKTILSEEQVDSLLNYLKNDLNRPNEACLLALGICSGARVSELLRFKTSIIDENNSAFDDLFLETLKPIKTKGFSKTGKPLVKYIIKDIFLPYYNDWLIERKKIMQKYNTEHDSIFITRDGKPATLHTIRGWIEKWEKFLEIPFYFHCLRHYTVTHMTRLGLDSDFIIEIMGWSSSEMYKVYNDLTAKERKWKGLDKLKNHLDDKDKIEEDSPST